ncbi:MAG: hypothetical protein HYU70_09175 [Bacteroidetes bacterium]|nr:hypothetical protein [Bacteroidota bacterium]
MISYELKFQFCNLSDALHRNVTDNFESVSFNITKDNFIQVQVVLKEKTSTDMEYIDDFIAEFSALQETDNVLPPIVKEKDKNLPLKYVVFQQG